MTLELGHPAYRNGQVGSAAWFYTLPQLGEGKVWAIGKHGDKDPGYVLDCLIARNTGTLPYWIGRTLSDALSGYDRISIEADVPLPFEGEHDALYIYNPQGGGGTIDGDLTARQLPRRNSGHVGVPGNGEFVVRATPVANATTVFTITVRAKITLSFCKTWTKVPASGAACTMAVAGPGGNLLTATTVNVAALTTVTYETQALTATASRLDLNPGDQVTITIVGANGLTPGDLLVALGWTLR